MFLVVAKKSRTFSQFPVLGCCAGVQELGGSAASPAWPAEIFRTTGVMLGLYWGLAGGGGNFSMSEFGKFCKICEF